MDSDSRAVKLRELEDLRARVAELEKDVAAGGESPAGEWRTSG